MKRIETALAVALGFMHAAEAPAATGGNGGGEEEAKRVAIAEHEFDEETGDYQIKFSDGNVIEFNADKIPESTRRRLFFHGIRQKTGDSYASVKGNVYVAREKAQSVVDQLLAGEWKAARGEGESRPRLGELAEAFSRIKGISLQEATEGVTAAAALDGDDAAKKAGAKKLAEWRAHPKVKSAIADIRAEKARKELEQAAAAAPELVL